MWLVCGGDRFDGKPGYCDRKLAKVLDSGQVDIQRREMSVSIYQGVGTIECSNCGKVHPIEAPIVVDALLSVA